ncbi:MAG: hypothetical protein ACP5I8_15540 [Phycisphaerae bacterium]
MNFDGFTDETRKAAVQIRNQNAPPLDPLAVAVQKAVTETRREYPPAKGLALHRLCHAAVYWATRSLSDPPSYESLGELVQGLTSGL